VQRAAIQDLFGYCGFAWQQIADAMSRFDPGLVAKPAPGSGWPALRDCFGHMLLAYEDWIAELEGRPMLEFDPAKATTFAEIDAYSHTVRERFQVYLDSLSDEELNAERHLNVDGEMETYTPAQLLANLVIHERGHHGDINTLFYQHGIPEVDWPWIEYRAFVGARRGYL
jgi:uncharacterized damage-inducible protein DinB